MVVQAHSDLEQGATSSSVDRAPSNFEQFRELVLSQYPEPWELPRALIVQKLDQPGREVSLKELAELAYRSYYAGEAPKSSPFSIEEFRKIVLHAIASIQQKSIYL